MKSILDKRCTENQNTHYAFSDHFFPENLAVYEIMWRMSRVDRERKIRSRKQRMDTGKYSFVIRTIQDWNQIPAEVLGTLPCKLNTLKKKVRKAITEVN
jgi:hypothetical protein